MSVPTAALGAVAAAPVLDPLDALLMTINSNPYFIGVMMILLNLGGRFLALEVTKGQEQFFQNAWVRRFLIFVVLFMGTRNVLVAFWMTIVIVLLIGYLFNENSSLCLFNLGKPGSSCAEGGQQGTSVPGGLSAGGLPTAPVVAGGLSQEEGDILKRLQDKAQRFASIAIAQQKQKVEEKKQQYAVDDTATYWQNISMLQKGEGFGNPRF
jgi:hypothetical protein